MAPRTGNTTSRKRAAAGKKGGQKTAAKRANTGATKRGTASARGGPRATGPNFSLSGVMKHMEGLPATERQTWAKKLGPWAMTTLANARAPRATGRSQNPTRITGNSGSQQEARTGTGG